MKNEITATITGRGEASTIPGNPGAVDAEIKLNGAYLCDVTLCPDPADHDGRLVAWGQLWHWSSDACAAHQHADAIIDAVRAVA